MLALYQRSLLPASDPCSFSRPMCIYFSLFWEKGLRDWHGSSVGAGVKIVRFFGDASDVVTSSEHAPIYEIDGRGRREHKAIRGVL